MSLTRSYPFSAIVGQDEARLALLLASLDASLGGVLLRGEKGTGKSTLARALAALLPGRRLATLPLGATEDRVVGGVDLQATIAAGRPVAQPGLLAGLDGGVLYVDEVNLLPDHLVDVILDAATTGIVRLEREGVCALYPARFTLIGTMNPEEGELRPQLLDRFGLCVQVRGETEVETRVEIIERTLDWGGHPEAFTRRFADRQQGLRDRLAAARDRLSTIVIPDDVITLATGLAMDAAVAGSRADILLTAGARAHAAWCGRPSATQDDVLAVAELVLRHRRRPQLPPEQPQPAQPPTADRDNDSRDQDGGEHDSNGDTTDREDDNHPAQDDDHPAQDTEHPDEQPPEPTNAPDNEPSTPTAEDRQPRELPDDVPDAESTGEDVPSVGEAFAVVALSPASDRITRQGSGRRHRSTLAGRRGRYVRALPLSPGERCLDLALDATLRAAAVHQRSRRAAHPDPPHAPAILVRRDDWRRKVRLGYTASCVVFLVDASGSMGARGRMVASKGAVLSLLLDAYVRRDRVALVSFRRTGAELLVAPTPSVEVANRALRDLPVGGRTPLSAGLVSAHDVIRPLLARDPDLRPLVVVVTDGHANVTLAGEPSASAVTEALHLAETLGNDQRITWIVVDTEDPRGIRLGYAAALAHALRAPCHAIDDLRAEDLVGLVKGHLP